MRSIFGLSTTFPGHGVGLWSFNWKLSSYLHSVDFKYHVIGYSTHSDHFEVPTTTCSRPLLVEFRKTDFIFFFLGFENPQIQNFSLLRFFFHSVDFRFSILGKEFSKNFGLTWKATPKSLYQTARIIFLALTVFEIWSIQIREIFTFPAYISWTNKKIGKFYSEKLFYFLSSTTQIFIWQANWNTLYKILSVDVCMYVCGKIFPGLFFHFPTR